MKNLPDRLLHWTGTFADAAIAAGIAIAVAFAVHMALFALFARFARLSAGEGDDEVVRRLREPGRWSIMAVAVSLAAEASPALAQVWEGIARFAVPALMGWTAYALVKALAFVIDGRAERKYDEMAARSRKTRVTILSRTAGFVIIVITIALMLFNIPAVRSVGVTLMASAGLAALAVGAAAQPALKSLIAGLQMALTEPIRIGDLVMIDNENGRVEDIRMSYVVIRTGDERRIIVPTMRFLDTTFQNWTRVSGGLTGSVVIPVKPCHPIAPIREAFLAILRDSKAWDGRKGVLNVTEARVGSVDLKLVMSAATPSELDRLRLAVREAMLEWLRENMPEALCTET
ncbi:MAG: mechanosensitive ion channel family protein [Novosphingobium sp.]|nr:mechanosensitive ion channel family protein [Novosphingobium sp.]